MNDAVGHTRRASPFGAVSARSGDNDATAGLVGADRGGKSVAAFPIMMGSCAFLMTDATKPFVDKGSYSLKSALGLAIGGFPAVLIAAYIVKSLPMEMLRWGVAAVVPYTSIAMLYSAFTEKKR